MATITKIERKSGVRYRAQIRIRRNGRVVYSESETFGKKALAKAWADSREAELGRPGGLDRVRHNGVTVADVLRYYLEDFDGLSKFGRSKLSHIQFLINYSSLSGLGAFELSVSDLVDHAKSRRDIDGAGASTINNDFIWLGNAYRDVRVARGLPLNQSVLSDAVHLCRRMGLIARSGERDRRPSLAELDRLLEYFSNKRSGINMVRVVLFAIFSARRQDEICRIRYSGLDRESSRVLVEDMKHPRKKVDTWCFLPDRAMAIIGSIDGDGAIFDYNGKSVSAAFTRACSFLGIDDLRFHDLRHEGVSHLFELGWDIPRVASVSGHRSWQTLQRYTHLYDLGVKDKYADWPWLASVSV